MKGFAILSILYIYLETGLCIEETDVSPSDEISGTTADRSDIWHRSVAKRNTAFKRLPAWSVYYGKRSSEPPFELRNPDRVDTDGTGLENIRENEITDDDGSDPVIYHLLGHSFPEKAKRTDLTRRQSWLSTYGKRSDFHDTSYDTDSMDSDSDIADDTETSEQALSELIYDTQPDFGIDDWKRVPGWHAMYGKRIPGWSATYGKRSPSWLSTYGKRLAGWSATYGKRGPTWSITYGKRAPGWSVTYGKRIPGWSVTYGKRVPWGATYGKRVPWGATYGKRSQGWNALYGKRARLWQAVYGKRDGNSASADDENTSIIDKSDDTSDIGQKRSQAWSAFYGR